MRPESPSNPRVRGTLRRSIHALTLVPLLSSVVFAAVLRVPEDHATIQAAIGAAVAGDTVSVGPGTYEENLDFLGKAITVASRTGPDETIIDGVNGSVVTFQTGERRTSVLEGFTLQGGGASHGGGIFCLDASPTIRGNIVRSNGATWGGGIACAGTASPRVVDNLITDNRSKNGGGVACIDDATPIFKANAIEENRLSTFSSGGGIYCEQNASPAFIENRIVGNGSDHITRGGAAYIVDGATPIFYGNVISGNRAEFTNTFGIHVNNSPGFRAHQNLFVDQTDAPLFIEYSPNAELIGNRFVNCRNPIMIVYSGGTQVIRNEFLENDTSLNSFGGGSLHVEGSFFRDNRRGPIFSNEGTVTFVNCVVRGNENEGIRCVSGADVFVENCTIFGNESGHLWVRDSSATIVNSILWNNTTNSVLNENSVVEITHSVVAGGFPGAGNVDVDPMLADPGSDEFHLRIGSPCIDAGAPGPFEHIPKDIDGDRRVLGDAIDMGADEFRGDIALRFGYVNNEARTVLRVNGTRGNHKRVVRTSPGEPLAIDMETSPAGPSPARFALYAWLHEPDETTFSRQPFNFGWTVFPTPLQGPGANRPVLIWNNIGREPRLGIPDRESEPAPSMIVNAPNGAGLAATVTLQGFIEDFGSRGQRPFSITNAIVVRVEE